MFTSFQASAEVLEKKKPLSIALRKDVLSEVVAMTVPCALVDSSAPVTAESTMLVVVAVPDTVRPPVTVPFPIVVDAWKMFAPVKVLFEYDLAMVVEASAK